jgi:hypothetical protein
MKPPAVTPLRENRTGDQPVKLFVKTTPQRDGSCARTAMYVEASSEMLDWTALPAGLKITNDFFGDDPDVLLLEMDDAVDEIPDIFLEAAAIACERFAEAKVAEVVDT